MKLNISTDIIPIGEFKREMTRWIHTTKATGHPLIITQNGKPAAVMLSPNEYDNLRYTERFVQSVNQGLSDMESGNFMTTGQLKDELKKQRKAGKID